LDTPEAPFPFPGGHFDAIVCLATIEHVIHLDHFVEELRRILRLGGNLYLSAPNYAGLPYLIPFLLSGRAFHDPLNPRDRYEFFAHVRYFTYRTMLDYVESKGFAADTVYLPLPAESTRYQQLRSRSLVKARFARQMMHFLYRFGSPRWCSEPVVCFRKTDGDRTGVPRKVIL
jgi:SAM-dependent methyltransferase